MPRLEGPRLVLRELRRDDIDAIHRWVNDPEVTRYLSWAVFPQTRRETERFVEAQMTAADPSSRAFAIAPKDDDAICIGTGGIHGIDWRTRSGELGIVIGDRAYQGKGYGTEAVGRLVDFAFAELNLHRVHLRVFDFNERARRCYLRCGFVEEGRLRQAFYRDGRYCDVLLFSILEPEWRARRTAAGTPSF